MYLLKNLIRNLENDLSDKGVSESIVLRTSNVPNFDFQINNLVKLEKSSEIEDIEKSFSKILYDDPIIKNFEFTKNYFINLEINIQMYLSNNENLIENIKASHQKNIILDYGGPNIGKPLHVGHLRSLNIGRSLYNINKLAGHNVANDIHLGDWGMPIAQIICFINENNINLEDIKIEDLEEIYPKASKLYQQDEDFKSLAQNINKELNENKADLINKWEFIKEVSIKAIKETLSLLDHNFDLWMGESDVNRLIPEMIANLRDNEKISLDNGAYISNLDTDPKILITKSDGSYLYLTTDLATVLNRKKESNVDRTLYIVDKRQKLHFQQLFDSINYFEFGNEEYTHVEFGTINDLNGNPFKTRDGDTKKLIDLMKNRGGSIINISSIASLYGFPNNPGYNASKAALNSMTKSLANDFAKYNIRCNSLLLGYFKSKMTIKSFKNSKSRKARERHTVFQRWGKNKEVLGPVLFLSSDLSSYITGQNIVVDGGWTIKGFN